MAGRAGIIVCAAVLSAGGAAAAGEPQVRELFDFRQADTVDRWRSINDVVMGGVSTGRMEATGSGPAAFVGEVSLENNGGFASVRSLPQPVDLAGYAGLELRVRGDGQRYKMNLKSDADLDGILYRAAFQPPAGEWRTLRIPFRSFEPTFRGRRLRDAPPLDPASIASFGLMISDRQAGPFRLEIERIGAYRD